MNIYLVQQPDLSAVDYDDYRGFVCYAKDEAEARLTHPGTETNPNGDVYTWEDINGWYINGEPIGNYAAWQIAPQDLKVTLLGQGKPWKHSRRIILTDYKAG